MAVIYGTGAGVENLNSLYTTGKILMTVRQKFILPTSVVVGDRFILARGLSYDSRILSIIILPHGGVSGATGGTLGFYQYSRDATAKGTAVTTTNPEIALTEITTGVDETVDAKDVFGTFSLATARTSQVDLLSSLSVENFPKNIGQLLGLSSGRDTPAGAALVWESTTAFSATANTSIGFVIEIDPSTQG